MAAIPSALVEVPFARGVDQKTDPRWVGVGSQTSVINGSWTKNGSLRKRLGFAAVGKSSFGGIAPTLAAGVAVEAYKNAPIVSDGSHLYSYSSLKNILLYQDQLPECIASRTPLAQSTAGIVSADSAYTNGLVLYVYRAVDATGTLQNYATIVDAVSQAQIAQSVLPPQSNNNGLRCVAVGTDFWVFWTDASKNVVATRYPTAPPFVGWGGGSPLVALSTTGTVWDVCPIDGGSGFTIAYQDNGAPNHVHVTTFDANGLPAATYNTAVAAGVSLPLVGVAVRHIASEMCWVMYVGTDGASHNFNHAFGLDPSTLTSVIADQALWTDSPIGARHCGIGRVSSTTAVFVSSNGTGDVSYQQFTNSGLVGPLRTQYGYQMWSKPTEVNGNVVCCFYRYGDATNFTFQLVDLVVSDTTTTGLKARPIATIAPRSASFIGGMDNTVSPHIASMGASKYALPVSVSVSTSRDAVYHTVLDFGSQQRHQAVELGNSAYLAGGVPSVFDGAQVTECGFLNAPTLGNVVVNAGGAVDVGQHQYAVVYKWSNAVGELVRSQPVFTGQATTSSGNQTVSIQVAPYNMTTKQDAANAYSPAVTFDLYRNTIADPATFWQVFSDTSETVSDPRTSSGFVTITDTIADATLTGNAFSILYTLGGVLTSQCPPSLTCLTAHKGRIFAVGDDATTLWYTQQFTTGFQPAWNDQLTIVSADGGGITGLASMDDSLVIFKRDRIFRLYGTGPNNTGSQSDFSDPVRCASDVGCTQSRSVVLAPQGVFFLSLQGIYLLSRAGDVQYIGRAVEDTVAANPVCLASDLVATRGEIRWSLAPSLTSSTGVVVVYDYIQDAWSVHQYYDSDQAVSSAIVKGAKAPGGTWAWIGAGGQVNIESNTSYLDGSQWVTLSVESAWVKASGIAGWARFRRVTAAMEQKSPFQLTVSVATDLSDTYTQSSTWTDMIMSTWATPKPLANMQIGNQKTEAVRIKLSDAAPTTLAVGTGQGPIFLGMNVEVAQLGGSKGSRVPATQRG